MREECLLTDLATSKGFLGIEDFSELIYMSLLQRWLREVHDIRVLIDFETIDDSETAYTFKIVKYLSEGKGRKKDTWDFYETTYSFTQGGGWYKTYEEALELGLIKGLKLIK